MGRFGKAAVAGGAVIATGFLAAGAGLLKIGDDFDSAYDSIAIATGKTGDALADLEQSFRDVASSGPYAFDDVSTAIGDLNTRVGLTGDPLETLSQQFLDLSRITETDVSKNIEGLTQTFNKWGVPADEMSERMDQIFRATQVSGIGLDELSGTMTKFGAPMQQLGFSFEETTALLAGFEVAGIDTQAVMTGMRRGLVKMAKDGEAPAETLQRVTDQIANMQDPTEATALAVELFGSKAGPEMVEAIQSGQFSVEGYLDAIANGESTISGTASATDDWREKLQTLRNKILVKLEPLANKVFGALTTLVGKASDAFDRWWPVVERALGKFSEWFRSVWPGIKDAIAGFVSYVVDTFGPMVSAAFALVGDVIGGVVDFITTHWSKISSVVGGVVDIVRSHIEGLVGFFRGIFDAIRSLIDGDWAGAWDALKGAVVSVVESVVGMFKGFAGKILPVLSDIGGWLVDKGAQLLNGLWNGIQDVWTNTVWPWLQDLPATLLKAVPSLLQSIATRGKQLLNGLWNGIKDVWWGTILPWLKDLGTTVLRAIPSLLDSIATRGKQLLNGLWNGIKDVWNNTIKPWLAGIGTDALLAIPSLLDSIATRGKQLLNGLWNGIRDVWNNTVYPWLTGLGSTILGAIGNAGTWLYQTGKDLISGLVSGINSWAGSIGTSVLNGVISFINSLIDKLNGAIDLADKALGPFINFGSVPRIGKIGNVTGARTGTTGNVKVLHDGGWVGSRGLRADEVPAILQTGEYVMSRDEVAGRSTRSDSPLNGRGGLTVNGGIHVGSTSDLPSVGEHLERMAFLARNGAVAA